MFLVNALAGTQHRYRPPAFDPLDWFADGEEGFWFDIQDLSSMFQTTDTSTPAAVGSPVGRVNDKSGNGHHIGQADAAKRPILRQNAKGKYYLEFDGVNDNLTMAVDFGAVNVLTTLAGLRNRAQTNESGYLQMATPDAPGPSQLRVKQLDVGPDTAWSAGLSGIYGETVNAAAVAATTAPNDMVMVSQHSIPADLSTIRVNGVDGEDGLAEKGSNALGNVTVNIGTDLFKPTMALDLYGLIVRGALTEDMEPAEYYMDAAMGGNVMPVYSPPGPPLVKPDQGFARELGGRFPWMAFAQPEAQFPFWSDVGVDILDSWNPAVSGVGADYDPAVLSSFNSTHLAAAEAWDSAAIAAGFKIARFPHTPARAEADVAEPMRSSVVGWPVFDEPEGINFDIGPQLALMDAADPDFGIPRAINAVASSVIYPFVSNLVNYYGQMSSYPAVQGMFDYYPVQQNPAPTTLVPAYRPSGAAYTASYNSMALASARSPIWTIASIPRINWMSDAPFAAFIATAGFVTNEQTVLRVPTPDQVRFQVADAIVMGAEGISFFPQRFEWISGARVFTSHNATPLDVKAQIITTMGHWRALETGFATNLLVDPATNRIWPTTYRLCPDTVPSMNQTAGESGLTFAAPPTVEYLPGAFQGSVREVDGVGSVYFIQNVMNEAKSLTDAAWGLAAVSFAAWETLVFIEGDMANPVWSDIDGPL